ncbi:DUF1315 family protein [Vibrio sp. SS-MA-C1-2]|uniref:YeaC family protein n=1 Tax=Vibrio sp. SS-MA-C1-2 TaxID=2908646 RepID=UPI001F20B71F|nr:DUF1315 family protein [Vibrio sp. SS-MA-C1-2]UJF19854.1 DUF1315 family protein [Vibrio sp. SS-MA-C1-2]
MDIEKLCRSMTPEVYQALQLAVEIGKWPTGEKLTKEQIDACMQGVMLYQSRNNVDPQHLSIAKGGEMVLKSKRELVQQFSQKEEDIVRVKV